MLNFFCIIFLLLTTQLFSIEAGETPALTGNAALGIWELETASHEPESRLGYQFSLFHTYHQNIRGQGQIFIIPDLKKRSGLVNIKEHFFAAGYGLEGVYPFLFRFYAGLEPMIYWVYTSADILGGKDSFSSFILGVMGQLGVEYVVNERVEVRAGLEYGYRISDKKLDSAYEIGLNLNL